MSFHIPHALEKRWTLKDYLGVLHFGILQMMFVMQWGDTVSFDIAEWTKFGSLGLHRINLY